MPLVQITTRRVSLDIPRARGERAFRALATAIVCVVVLATSPGPGYGILAGSQGGQGIAGKFEGSIQVTGTLIKSGGGCRIDHPLDPENRYLQHSFVESPDMMNVYCGTTVLDDRGEAEVTLPDWFEALNRDFRYQLTCIGQVCARFHFQRNNTEQVRHRRRDPRA